MSNIFSKWSFITKSGIEVPIPIGVSKPNEKNRNSLVITVSSDGDRVAEFSCDPHNVHSALIDAIKALLTFYNHTKKVGHFRDKKRARANPAYPVGVHLSVKADGKRVISTTYPNLITSKANKKNFQVGTENDWQQYHDVVLEKAIQFRNNAMVAYREEFIKRAKNSLALLMTIE